MRAKWLLFDSNQVEDASFVLVVKERGVGIICRCKKAS
jgi:hypothetical protein